MADINYWYEEYDKEVSTFMSLCDKLDSLILSSNNKAITSNIEECEQKSSRIKEVKKSYGLELRLVRDKAIKSEFDSKGRELDEKFTTATRRFVDLRNRHNKKDLMNNATTTVNPYSTDGKNNDTLLGEANKIQDLTFESLARSRNMIEASKEVGKATIEQLQQQKEQIIEIEKEVDILDSNLVRAEKLLLSFTRRMATDRIIQLFFTVNVVIMLGLILYVVISGRSLSPTDSSTTSSSVGPPKAGEPTAFPTVLPTYTPSFR